MDNRKKGIYFFTCAIVLIFLLAIIQEIIYANHLEKDGIIKLDKSDFRDIHMPEYDINSRSLKKNEEYRHVYAIDLSESVFTDKLSDDDTASNNWYIMIEKPDSNYLGIRLNNHTLGEVGDKEGRANLWNGTFFLMINDDELQEKNRLTITMYSEFRTGIQGSLLILTTEEYKKIAKSAGVNSEFITGAIVVSFFSAFILFLILFAWKNRLYNKKSYLYFSLAIIFIGIGLFDYKVLPFMSIDYTTYKKIMMICYHLAIMCSTLAVTTLLNVKRKMNFGMVGVLLIVTAALFSRNMIEFAAMYEYINFAIILSAIQLFITLIVYRHRSPINSLVMLLGFGLCLVIATRLVLVTSQLVSGNVILELSVLAIIHVLIVIFIVFNELLQMGENIAMHEIMKGEYRINDYMQGAFSIDKSLKVVGTFSISCNQIFDQYIMGKPMLKLFDLDDENYRFFHETLTMIFNEQYEFKDGFIALLPSELTIKNRIYQVEYMIEKTYSTVLHVVMNDITIMRQLEEKLEENKQVNRFIVNAVKFQRELEQLILKVDDFMKRLTMDLVSKELLMEIHTIKGNLSQFGFVKFEKGVHEMESFLEEHDWQQLDTKVFEQKKEQMYLFFKEEQEVLKPYLGSDFMNDKRKRVEVSVEYINYLECMYLNKHKHDLGNMSFLKALKRIRYINLKELFKRYSDYIDTLSLQLNRYVMPLEILGDNVFVDPKKSEALIMVMAAVFRNALVHGIEDPETRIEMGKDSCGQLTCRVDTGNGYILISISDDGRGMDPEAIGKLAVSKGIITSDQFDRLNDEEKLKLIFESSMSVKKEVDLYSGRGYGLASVKQTIKKYGGRIKVESIRGEGTHMHFEVPCKSLID